MRRVAAHFCAVCGILRKILLGFEKPLRVRSIRPAFVSSVLYWRSCTQGFVPALESDRPHKSGPVHRSSCFFGKVLPGRAEVRTAASLYGLIERPAKTLEMADTGAVEYKRSNHQTSQSPSLSLRFQHFQVLRADKFQIALQIVRILFNLLPVFRPCQKIWVLSKREFSILDKGVIGTFNRSDVDGMIRRCFAIIAGINGLFQGFLVTFGQCPFVPLYFF